MKNIIDKRTGKKETVYSVREEDDKMFIRFKEGGTEYSYFRTNIETLPDTPPIDTSGLLVYSLEQVCYRCQKTTEVLTYMLFADKTRDNLVYPWDKKRLNSIQSTELLLAHMQYEHIEFYPIMILGSDDKLDKLMLEQFPDRISMATSKTQNRTYPMNICQHCKAKQGEFYIYERINKLIAKKQEIKVYATIPL